MAIINTATADYSVVQAAIAMAVDGDTVKIGQGSATWAAPLAFSKAINLVGAGIDKTIITHTVVGIEPSVPAPNTYEISDMTLIGPAGGGFNWMDAPFAIGTFGDCQKFRFTRLRLVNTGSNGGYLVRIGYLDDLIHQYGVIDSCKFESGKILILGGGMGDRSWKTPAELGTDKAVYIEDCEFDQVNGAYNNAVDCNEGARYVFRYNHTKDQFIMAHSCMNGDKDYFSRGTRSVETYENVIEATRDGIVHFVAIYQAAGTGVHFNNKIKNSGGSAWIRPIGLEITRLYEAGGGSLGLVTGSNPIDGNVESNGYPAIDQPGRGLDATLNPVQWPPYTHNLYHPQALEPIYYWGNTCDGVPVKPEAYNGGEALIKENRDYYNAVKPGYVPYTYPHPLRSGDTPMAQTKTAQVLITITAAPVTPDWTIGMTPPTSSVQKGTPIVLNVKIDVVVGTGWTGPATLSLGALPTGCTGAFSKTSVNPGETVTLTINTTNNAAPVSNFAVIVTAVG